MAHIKFAELFRAYLARSGYFPAKLARELKVHRSAVSKWENGTNTPTPKNLQKLSLILKLSEDERKAFFKAAEYEEFAELADPKSLSSPPEQEPLQTIDSTSGHIPLQRPPRVPYFTGRDEEIKQILEALQLGRAIALCGPGGIGKSAIAAEVLWRLSPGDKPPKLYPGGIIHYNFYGQGTATLALEHITRSLGIEPQPTPEAAARRALAGKRVLLLLEGTENVDHLNIVLNEISGCGIIITSRRREDAIDHRYRHDIKSLPLINAVELLQDWGGRRAHNEVTARKICRLVDRIPLAIRLVGRYLAESDEDIDEYILWFENSLLLGLHRGKHQDMSLILVMQRTLDKVSEEAKQALAVIGCLVLAPFRGEIIGKMLGISIDAVSPILAELVNYSILERPDKDYQVVHALIHTYAREHMTVPGASLERLADNHASLDKDSVIHVILKCAEQNKWEKILQIAQEVMYRFIWNAREGFEDVSIENMVTLNKCALSAARELKDQINEFLYLKELCRLYEALHQYQQVIECYQRAIDIAQDDGNPEEQKNLLWGLARVYENRKQFDKAIECYQKALSFAQDEPRPAMIDGLLKIYSEQKQFGLAIELCKQVVGLLSVDSSIKSRYLGKLGDLYYNTENYQEAIDFYKQAIELSSFPIGFMDSLRDIFIEVGQLEEAVKYFQRQISLFPQHVLDAHVNTGVLLLLRGENAQNHFEVALNIIWERLVDVAYDFGEMNERNINIVGSVSFQATGKLFKLLEYRALALLGLGKETLAIDHLKVALELRPPHYSIRFSFVYEHLAKMTNPPKGADAMYQLLHRSLTTNETNFINVSKLILSS